MVTGTVIVAVKIGIPEGRLIEESDAGELATVAFETEVAGTESEGEEKEMDREGEDADADGRERDGTESDGAESEIEDDGK